MIKLIYINLKQFFTMKMLAIILILFTVVYYQFDYKIEDKDNYRLSQITQIENNHYNNIFMKPIKEALINNDSKAFNQAYYDYALQNKGLGNKNPSYYKYFVDKNIPIKDLNASNERIYKLYTSYFIYFFLATIIIVTVYNFSKNVSNETFKTMFTQPYKKITIFFSQVISNYLISVIICGSLFLILFLIYYYQYGFTSFDYPLDLFLFTQRLTNNTKGTLPYLILSQGMHILYTLSVYLLLGLSTCILLTYLMYKTKNSIVPLLILVGIMFTPMILEILKLYKTKLLLGYSPFSYILASDMLVGFRFKSMVAKYLLPTTVWTITLQNGITCNIIFIIIMILLSFRLMKKIEF